VKVRAALWFITAAAAAHAGIVSQNWRESTLTIQLDDGSGEIEWISPVAFRVSRQWGESPRIRGAIKHDPVLAALDNSSGSPSMRTRYLTLDLDANFGLRVSNGETRVAEIALRRNDRGAEIAFSPYDQVYGLGGGSLGGLNLKRERIARRNGFFFTSNGYALFVREPEQCNFDFTSGTIGAGSTTSLDFVFYYGPTPKEILEQHHTVTGAVELKPGMLAVLTPERLPSATTRLSQQIRDWTGLADFVRRLNELSLSGVLYPAFDMASVAGAPDDVKQRATDLASILPLVYNSGPGDRIDRAQRSSFTPYLATYLREAFDRGYPLIHPLLVQFPRDPSLDARADLFLLGDELLVAPVIGPASKRRLDLPRGRWTDLRTDVEYTGSRSVEIDAPAGHVPIFARNGSLLPLAGAAKTELHYFPSLGGEFFLWEPDLEDISQFHAAPAGDFMRIEIETKVPRTYEWVLHHTKVPSRVSENSMAYKQAESRDRLQPGAWWHDAQSNNLHIMLAAEADSDRIVNVEF
jgi:hypothetical protein